MTRLASIPVAAEPIANAWDNSLAILHEIRHGLKRLADTGESTKIDLNAIPFGPGDEERLVELLGTGEVQADVDALGPTRVRETGIAGVWLVDYRNLDDQRLALHVEVATVPDILRSQPQDFPEAIGKLEALIQSGRMRPAHQQSRAHSAPYETNEARRARPRRTT